MIYLIHRSISLNEMNECNNKKRTTIKISKQIIMICNEFLISKKHTHTPLNGPWNRGQQQQQQRQQNKKYFHFVKY